MRKPQAATVPPPRSTSSHSAFAVPPVASRSSWTSTRAPGAIASECSSSASVPYSSTYSARTVWCGSLPGLRASTNPAPSSRARAGPSRNPRASALAQELAQVPDEQQVLEVRRHRREVLQRLDRLLAALGVAGAQGGGK